MYYSFDETVTKILLLNGWYPQRLVNIDKYRYVLEQNKYQLHESAERFLYHMGSLVIIHEAYSDKNETDTSEMNPLKPVSWLDPKWVTELYENIVHDKLCPVGLGFSEHMVFFISQSGSFYGGYDDYFCFIGDSIESAMSNLFSKHKFVNLN